MPSMLVEEISEEEKNPFDYSCGAFPVDSEPFTRETWLAFTAKIESWEEPIRMNWICPKCKTDIVTTENGKGRCFGCSSHWKVRPALTLVK